MIERHKTHQNHYGFDWKKNHKFNIAYLGQIDQFWADFFWSFGQGGLSRVGSDNLGSIIISLLGNKLFLFGSS